MKCFLLLLVFSVTVWLSDAEEYVEKFDNTPTLNGAATIIDSCTGKGVNLQGGVVESPKRGNEYLTGIIGTTVSAWVWLENGACASATCPIVVSTDENETAKSDFGIFYRPSDNKFVCSSGSSTLSVSAGLGEWTHITCVFIVSFQTIQAYVNFDHRETAIKLLATSGGNEKIFIGGYIDSTRSMITDPLLGKVALVRVLPGIFAIDVLSLGCYQTSSPPDCPPDYVCSDATPNPVQIPVTDNPVVGGTVSPKITDSPTLDKTPIPETPAPVVFSTYSPNELPATEKLILAVERIVSPAPSPSPSVAPSDTSVPSVSDSSPIAIGESKQDGDNQLPQLIVLITCMSVLVLCCAWAIMRSRAPPDQPADDVEVAASCASSPDPGSPPLSPVGTNHKLLSA